MEHLILDSRSIGFFDFLWENFTKEVTYSKDPALKVSGSYSALTATRPVIRSPIKVQYPKFVAFSGISVSTQHFGHALILLKPIRHFVQKMP